MNDVKIEDVESYWNVENIPQQWYSTKEYCSLQWFNELSYKRYNIYYKYLAKEAEFDAHQNEFVLEVGVGAGTDLLRFAQNGAHVWGVDLGADQVRMSTKNFDVHNVAYQEIVQASAENLPYDNNKFDLVYSFGVLHHTPDTEQAISEVHRVLKNDGHAVIMLYARGWKHYIKRCFIHGILRGKIFKYRFNWQKVYDDVSEVNGGSPKSGVYTRKQVECMFSNFAYVDIQKKRMGEFFEYQPYNTIMFPKFVEQICNFLKLESLFGENWLIKAYKNPPLPRANLLDVWFKHY